MKHTHADLNGLSGPVLAEGGHYTLALDEQPGAEEVTVPGVGVAWAVTSPTTLETFAHAARAVFDLRSRGVPAAIGLLVGDLAIRGARRPPGGSWAIPLSYRVVLREAHLDPAELRVWGEAYTRNQGKRRLLDAASRDAPRTYADQGWALLRDDEHVLLVSDASLEWEGELRAAVLSRGIAPLCPPVFAGLARAITRAGFLTHLAYYALPDDGWIDVKLRSGATTFAQLYPGEAGTRVHALIAGAGRVPTFRSFRSGDLVGPGERPWSAFLAEVRAIYPRVQLMEAPCPSPAPCSARPPLRPSSPSSA